MESESGGKFYSEECVLYNCGWNNTGEREKRSMNLAGK